MRKLVCFFESLCNWSGIRESNPRFKLGKLTYYHCTNPANRKRMPFDSSLDKLGLRSGQNSERILERMTGVEPATFAMARRRSSQLSYIRLAAKSYGGTASFASICQQCWT